MKSRLIIFTIAALSLGFGLLAVSAQQPDEEVRGAFLSTRPKTTDANAPARRRHRQRSNSSASSSKNANAAANTNSGRTSTANANQNASTAPQPIALGYTLFMRDINGRAVRVEPTREFHNGDRVRLSMEPNIDGYLYIFDSEDGGPPQMIYPDARLEGGDNWIEAHVPLDLPSSVETDERLRWFQFYGNSNTDQIYIVVSREPLADVPYGNALLSFCAANKDKCPWRPSVDVWTRIQQAAKADVKVVTDKTFGQAQTEKEQLATTRGLGLDQSAPQPSVIRMNASTAAPVLVAVLDLVHK